MKSFEIYYKDLKEDLQDSIAKECGYEDAEALISDTNWDVFPVTSLEVYEKGEEVSERPYREHRSS
jgi:hypothetical protein